MTRADPSANKAAHTTAHRRLALVALSLSVALHIRAYFLVYRTPPPPPAAHPPIDIEVIVTPQKKAAAMPTAAAQPVAAPKAVSKPPPLKTLRRAPRLPLPAPSPLQKTPTKSTPMRIGLSVQSTTPSESVAMQASDGASGASQAKATDANAASASAPASQSSAGLGVVQSFALTQAPVVDSEPDLRAYYPADAARAALEGQVVLSLTIDATGKVVAASVTKSAGHGFDEAARRAALDKLHFKPAQHEGRNVATQISYTLTFLLD